MAIIYLIGEFLAMYMAYRIFRHEDEFDIHTRVGMIIGVAFFSWIAVSLMLVHLKLHYKSEFKSKLNLAIKQKNLLINERSCDNGCLRAVCGARHP